MKSRDFMPFIVFRGSNIYTLIVKVPRILKQDVVYNGNLLHMFEKNVSYAVVN